MYDVNRIEVQHSNYQTPVWNKPSEINSLGIATTDLFIEDGIIDIQQEVEELKKLRESVVSFPEYVKRKAALKAYLQKIHSSSYSNYK